MMRYFIIDIFKFKNYKGEMIYEFLGFINILCYCYIFLVNYEIEND